MRIAPVSLCRSVGTEAARGVHVWFVSRRLIDTRRTAGDTDEKTYIQRLMLHKHANLQSPCEDTMIDKMSIRKVECISRDRYRDCEAALFHPLPLIVLEEVRRQEALTFRELPASRSEMVCERCRSTRTLASTGDSSRYCMIT